MLRLLRLMPRNAADSPLMNGGPMRRESSPPGFSTLTTSAPMSASSIVQNGPAITCVQSRMVTPSSGIGGMFYLPWKRGGRFSMKAR